MAETISCPQCSSPLAIPDTIAPGSAVQCPKCSTTFTVPGRGESPIREGAYSPERLPPETEWDDDSSDWRDEPSEIGDYQVELGDYFGQANRHYSPSMGPMVGYGFLLFGIVIAQSCLGIIPILGPIIQFGLGVFVNFALYAGFPLVCLRQMQGRPWTFGDFFGGFGHYAPLLIVNLLSTLLAVVCLAPGYAFIIAAQFMLPSRGRGGPFFEPGNRPPAQFQQDPTGALTLLLIGSAVLLVGLLPFIYFSLRCFLFSYFFVLDRKCGAIEAIKYNWQLTRGHFWGWFGVVFILGLILVLAALPCGLGLPFALPFFYFVLTAGYLRVTNRRISSP